MKRNGFKFLVLGLCAIPLCSVAQEKHPIPVDNHLAIAPLYDASFYERYKAVLYDDAKERPAIKITVMPSFHSVFTLAFVRGKIKIRTAKRAMAKDDNVEIEMREIKPSKALYDSLSKLFNFALLQTRVDANFTMGLDGTRYYMSSFEPFKQRVIGMLWSPRPGSDMDELTKIISRIYYLKEEKESESELYDAALALLKRLKSQ